MKGEPVASGEEADTLSNPDSMAARRRREQKVKRKSSDHRFGLNQEEEWKEDPGLTLAVLPPSGAERDDGEISEQRPALAPAPAAVLGQRGPRDADENARRVH